MDVPWKVILAFVGVFIAGAVFGGVFTLGVGVRQRAEVKQMERAAAKAVTRPVVAKEANPPRLAGNPIGLQLLNQFTRRLPNLTKDQSDTLRVVLSRAGEDLHRLRQQNFADVSRVTERMYADVAAVLTLEQRAELEAMRRQLEERMQTQKKKAAEAAEKEAAARAATTTAAPANRPGGTP